MEALDSKGILRTLKKVLSQPDDVLTLQVSLSLRDKYPAYFTSLFHQKYIHTYIHTYISFIYPRILAELRRPEGPPSGAPAARRAAKRSPIIIEKGTTRMHRNRNPCNSFLLVKMASGMDHGRVRPTTTTTTTTTNDVAQHGGHPANTKSCSVGLQHISLILDMHIMCN